MCNSKDKMNTAVNNVMLQSRRKFPEMNSVYTSAVNNGNTIGIGIFMLQSRRKFAAQMTSVDDAHVMAIHLAIHLVKTGVTKPQKDGGSGRRNENVLGDEQLL
jgi:hypothetical protein